MIIQCPECRTRFKLPDEKVKPGGTKVRCSRCKHIFTASGPDRSAEPPAAALPDEGVDFGSFNMQSLGEDNEAKPEPAAAFAPTAAETSQLSAGSRELEAPAAENARLANGPADREGRKEGPEEFSIRGDTSAAGGADAPEDEEPAGAPREFAFGDDEEASSGAGAFTFGDDEEPSNGAGAFTFGDDEEPAAADREFAFEDAEEAVPGAGKFVFSDAEPDAGSEFSFENSPSDDDPFARSEDQDFAFSSESGPAEDFDFSHMSFGEDQPEPETPPVPELTQASREGRPAPSVDLPQGRAPAPFPETEPIIAPSSASPRRSPFSRVLALVLFLLLVLAGAAGYFFWQGGVPDLSQLMARLSGAPQPPPASGQIRLTELTGSFVQNSEAGQLFIIRGKALNEFRESRSSIAVKGILYDDKGQPLLQQTVFSGNTLDEESLRTLPFARIEESMNNQFGDSLSNLNVGPGKSIPFTIIFKNLPPNLAEFTVEIADSKPGSS